MKPMIYAICIAISAFANEPADYIEGERSADLITPEVEQLAIGMLGADAGNKLIHAIKLNMAKYAADMKSKSGRSAWHGKMIKQIVDTNTQTSVEIYTNTVDGSVWRYQKPFTAKTASENVRILNSRLNTTYTNGIPVALAKARLMRSQEKTTISNVTVNAGSAK